MRIRAAEFVCCNVLLRLYTVMKCFLSLFPSVSFSVSSILHAAYSVQSVGMFLLFLCSGPDCGSPAGGSPSSCPSMLESAAAAAAAAVVEILWIRLFPDSASGDISVLQYFSISEFCWRLHAACCTLHAG